MFKKLTMVIISATFILSGCNEENKNPEAKVENVIACAFNKNEVDKKSACDSLNVSEKRILKCAIRGNGGPRKERCKDLTEAEKQLVPRVDAARTKGTNFDFTTRKLGE